MSTETTTTTEHLVLRIARSDDEDVATLAALDGRPIDGTVLVAQIGDRSVAALSLETGELVADPFTPTATAAEILRLRAAELTETRVRPWTPRLLRALRV